MQILEKPEADSSKFSGLLLAQKLTKKKVLVLDLDETLIHCRQEKFLNASAAIVKVSATNSEVIMHVSERPGLREFLEKMNKLYLLVLFTSATEEYAVAILKFVDIDHYFSNVLHREHCKKNESVFRKDLSILGVRSKDLIFVDPYTGDPGDRELHFIPEFLAGLAKEEDARPVMDRFVKFKDKSVEENRVVQMKRSEMIKKYLAVNYVLNLKGLKDKKNSEELEQENDHDTEVEDENFHEIDSGTEISKVFSLEKKLMDSLKISANSTDEKSLPSDDDSPLRNEDKQPTLELKFSPNRITTLIEEKKDQREFVTYYEVERTPRSTPDKLPRMRFSSEVLEQKKLISEAHTP